MPAPAVNWTKLMLGFGAMVVGQFMAILDIQIVASSLPQIQAGISASADEVSWIQTAYLVAEVVMIPLTAYLTRLWGTQKVYMASCLGFVVMSVLTGLSSNIETMIVTRALQGFIGGAMIPTVFAVAFTAFPPERRMTASIVMGLIVTLAPTVGPSLGGHLTELLSWRWLFFINVVPGLVVLFLVGRYGDFDKGDPKLYKGFDWFGLAVMAVFLMSLQYVLEEGTRNSWFQDGLILALSVAALVAGLLFIWRSLTYSQPIVELRAFSNTNFLIGVCMTFVSGASLFGGTYLLPLFLGRVRGYSAAEVGTTMVVTGLSMFLTGPLLGRFVRLVDPRLPIVFGFVAAGYGFWLGHAVTPQWGFWELASLQAFRGVGVMVAMIATQNVTMSTLNPDMVKTASGIVNLARNVGGAMGMAILSNTLVVATGVHMNEISSRMSVASLQAQDMMAGMAQHMSELGLTDPAAASRKVLKSVIMRDASTLAYGDAFTVLALVCFLAALAAIFIKPAPSLYTAPVESH
jgi:DHA2 family multidrug resistance protein